MGKFLETHVDLEEITVDNCPPTLKYRGGLATTLTDLHYTANHGEEIFVPKGYLTDGYTKPRLLEFLVGGRYEDDNRPSTVHDYLCQYHGYYTSDFKFIPVSFKRANDILMEAMKDCKIGKTKQMVYRIAVNFNPDKW